MSEEMPRIPLSGRGMAIRFAKATDNRHPGRVLRSRRRSRGDPGSHKSISFDPGYLFTLFEIPG